MGDGRWVMGYGRWAMGDGLLINPGSGLPKSDVKVILKFDDTVDLDAKILFK